VIHDAPFNHLVGDLAVGPVGNGAPRLAGGLTGHRDHGADLLRCNPWSLARARCVAESFFRAQLGQGDRLKERPAIAPEAHRLQTDLPRSGDGQVTPTLGGIEDDLGSRSDLLWGRVPPEQSLQGVALFVGQDDGHGLRTTHDCFLATGSRRSTVKPAQTILSGQLRQAALAIFR
jgi:hypothetical protein